MFAGSRENDKKLLQFYDPQKFRDNALWEHVFSAGPLAFVYVTLCINDAPEIDFTTSSGGWLPDIFLIFISVASVRIEPRRLLNTRLAR